MIYATKLQASTHSFQRIVKKQAHSTRQTLFADKKLLGRVLVYLFGKGDSETEAIAAVAATCRATYTLLKTGICLHSSVASIGNWGPLSYYLTLGKKAYFAPTFSFSTLNPDQQMNYVEECLEKGFPEINVESLFPRVQNILNYIQGSLVQREKQLAHLGPPVPNSKQRAQCNGGDSNVALYALEYRKGVAFFWNLLLWKQVTSSQAVAFEKVLEMLGPRRQRMVVLGDLDLDCRDYFGKPADRMMYTNYEDLGDNDFEERIGLRYGNLLPRHVTYTTHAGENIALTTISDTTWIHAGYKYRVQGMKEIAFLTKCVLDKRYEQPLELAVDLHRIYWLFAHLAPFLRGTPTASGMFVDALWLIKGYMPPEKTFDENCEALIFDNWQEFSQKMLGHPGL